MVEGEPRDTQELSEEEFDAAVKERRNDLVVLSIELFNELTRLDKKTDFASHSELDDDIEKRTSISIDELRKYPVYHMINGSTPTHEYCKKNMDLSGNLIENTYREILDELKNEKKEYSYDEGFEKALSEIEKILEKKDIVVVLVNGSGKNVGKTRLTGSLAKALKEKRIPVVSTGGDINSLYRGSIDSLKSLQEDSFTSKKGVIILSKEFQCIPKDKMSEYKESLDRSLKEQVENFDITVNGIDLYIAIYRKDKPFQRQSKSDLTLGDIMICNEKAEDSSNKI